MREENIEGIKVGGMSVQIFRFTNNITVIVECKANLTKMLKKMNDTLKKLKINQRKTKILICNKQQIYANIVLDEILLGTIQSFTYPGSKITR